jgi:hypothetical protein
LGLKILKSSVEPSDCVGYGIVSCDKPWKHLLKITDVVDRELFFNSTIMDVRNGRNTHFWEARWLEGEAPQNLAPNLYKVARFKRRSVFSELNNNI